MLQTTTMTVTTSIQFFGTQFFKGFESTVTPIVLNLGLGRVPNVNT